MIHAPVDYIDFVEKHGTDGVIVLKDESLALCSLTKTVGLLLGLNTVNQEFSVNEVFLNIEKLKLFLNSNKASEILELIPRVGNPISVIATKYQTEIFENQISQPVVLGLTVQKFFSNETVIINEVHPSNQVIFESNSIYVLKIDLQGIVLFANDFFYADFGWDKQKIIGKRAIQNVVEKDVYKCSELIRSCYLPTSERIKHQIERIDQNGNIKIAQWEYLPISETNGSFQQILCIGIDKTEELRNLKNLESSQEQFRFIAENTSDGIMLYEHGEIKYTSPSYNKILGYSEDEEKGRTEIEIFKLLHPEDRERVKQFAYQKMKNKVTDYRYRFRVLHKNGHFIWREDQVNNVYNDKGEVKRTIIVARDITQEIQQEEDLKSQKESLQSFLNEAYDLIQSIDEKGKYKFVNQNWLQTLGYTEKELNSLNFKHVLAEEYHTLWETVLQELKRQHDYKKLQVEFITKQGERIHVEGNLASHVTKENELVFQGIFRDISEEYQIQKENRTLLYHIQSILNNTAEAILGINKDGNLTFVNPACLKMLGLNRNHNYEGKTFQSLIISADGVHESRKLHESIQHCLLTGKAIHAAKDIIYRNDESTFTIEYWIHPIVIDGQLTGAVISFHDIDERNAKEAELHRIHSLMAEKNFELQSVLNSSGIGIWKMDMISGTVEWDNNLKKMFHVDDSIQFDYDFFIAQVHPDDRTKLDKAYREFLNENRPYDVEYRILKDSFQTEYHRSQATKLFDENGKLLRIIGITHDLTEKKSVEREIRYMQDILEQAGRVAKIGAWDFDLIQNHLTWSSVMKEIHEIQEFENPDFDEAMQFYVDGENRDRLMDLFANAAAFGTAFDDEFEIQTLKGNHKWVRVLGVGEFQDEAVVRVFGIVQDITEQVKQREMIEEAKNVAEQSNKAKSEFVANVSHEIRTPLNSIIGFSDLLLHTELSDKQKNFINQVKQSSITLLELINDVLDFSKIEAGKLHLNNEYRSLSTIVQQVIDLTRFQGNKKNIEFVLDMDLNLPDVVYIDEIRIKQILINLISNAQKFTSSGYVKLKIALNERIDDQRVVLSFEVKDTGIGISKQMQQKIFEAFEQEDASITRKYGGTGLGLSISNNLLKMMNSQMELQSVIGEGSTFGFSLELLSKLGTIHSKITREFNVNESKSVLLLSKQSEFCQIIEESFQKIGIPIEIIQNPNSIKDRMINAAFDVVLVDLSYPDVEMIDALKKAKEQSLWVQSSQEIVLLHNIINEEQLREQKAVIDYSSTVYKLITLFDLLNTFLPKQHENSIASEKKTDEIEPLQNKKQKVIHFLLVDDNPINQFLNESIIKSLYPNAVIKTAENGIEAIKTFESMNPDCILMDIQMPEMSGYDASREIRRREFSKKRVPIIALTANIQQGEEARCRAAGMDSYLSKPVSISHLASVLEQLLKN